MPLGAAPKKGRRYKKNEERFLEKTDGICAADCNHGNWTDNTRHITKDAGRNSILGYGAL